MSSGARPALAGGRQSAPAAQPGFAAANAASYRPSRSARRSGPRALDQDLTSRVVARRQQLKDLGYEGRRAASREDRELGPVGQFRRDVGWKQLEDLDRNVPKLMAQALKPGMHEGLGGAVGRKLGLGHEGELGPRHQQDAVPPPRQHRKGMRRSCARRRRHSWRSAPPPVDVSHPPRVMSSGAETPALATRDVQVGKARLDRSGDLGDRPGGRRRPSGGRRGRGRAAEISSSCAWRRPVTITRFPRSWSCSARPRPMPLVPPVTSTVLPVIFMDVLLSRAGWKVRPRR